MDRIARLSAAQRQELFTETAARQGMTPAVVEKDFWVTWVLDLLAEVVAFKERFYFSAWARYDLAVPGSLRLVPEGPVLKTVTDDYRAMANMIFGTIPHFEAILAGLQGLENEINGRSHN